MCYGKCLKDHIAPKMRKQNLCFNGQITHTQFLLQGWQKDNNCYCMIAGTPSLYKDEGLSLQTFPKWQDEGGSDLFQERGGVGKIGELFQKRWDTFYFHTS